MEINTAGYASPEIIVRVHRPFPEEKAAGAAHSIMSNLVRLNRVADLTVRSIIMGAEATDRDAAELAEWMAAYLVEWAAAARADEAALKEVASG